MKDVPLVLVADDEPTMREMVAHHLRTLTSPKLEVIEAGDGEEALRLARQHLPDLVVLDVMMPEMSGWEVCKKIREDVALAHTGVVMLTGIGHSTNEMTSPLYGADAYIDKPFEFPELDAKVKQALAARKKQRLSVPRATGSDTNGVIGLAKAMPRKKSGKAGERKRGSGKAAKRKNGKPDKKRKVAFSPKKAARKAAPKRKKTVAKKRKR